MDGLSKRNVICQVSNAAMETPYEVHGILCNVAKGSPPALTVSEFLDGESSTITCTVHNAIPAPVIDIRVGNVLLSDALQTDLFNGSSHTFTSTAKVTKTNKLWTGKENCCTRKIIDDFGIADHSICKNISIKCDPTLYLNTTSPVNLPSDTTAVVKCSQSHKMDIQTFQFPVYTVLIASAVFCGLCILFVIGRWICLKRRKDNAVNTIENVENHSDTASDNGVLHMETEGVQYAVVQRQVSTLRIETQASNHVMTTA
ncbi:uncharacterized protein LOC128234705 [Mya arenaria]|uniref:uncharacterized protein LOC128234705 n=1 Tax=Mya arenaria TaxID=6604 RepID=UPI0022E6F17E|nr:uncharacterized protein LOC128234705 [Mya arenaria]